MTLPSLTLKRFQAGPSLGRHPWVYGHDIQPPATEIPSGSEVEVRTFEGRFIGYGLYNSRSHIRCRLYSFTEEERLDESFWEKAVVAALRLRQKILPTLETGRLIFSEGDGLSGLIVDAFAGHLVVQITSLGIHQRRDLFFSLLKSKLNPQSISLRMEGGVLKSEGLEATSQPEWIYGDNPHVPVEIAESSIRFLVDLENSQKTGFYLDQRDNRSRLYSLAKGKRILDLFTYVGGFALTAAGAGAESVVGIDSSQPAIDLAKKNATLNNLNVEFLCDDVFSYLERAQSEGRVFDVVVVDPPRYSPKKGSKEKALQNYYRLNRMALQVVAPRGILISCSCSQQIKRHDFRAILAAVCRKEGRRARLFFQGSQAMDHPIDLACPETEYLKAFFCELD